MNIDDYLLQSPPEMDDDSRCPECGSDDYFFDSNTGENVCKICFTRAKPEEFFYDGGESHRYVEDLLTELDNN